MMLKFLLLIILMFFAVGVAAIMMRRMMSISQRIAELQSDMKKSEFRLESQMQVLEEERKKTESRMDENQVDKNTQLSDIEEKNS